MSTKQPVFSRDTFQFFRELARNNKKVWMDAHRDRYQSSVVQPFRRFLEEMAPAVLHIDPRFDATGRGGSNFSRINRDIRFAKDKTPYRPQMYLKFSVPFPGDRESGQLYVGLSADTVTAGFRIYSGPKRKESSLALIAEPRIQSQEKWLAKQKKRLSRKYESYWYSTVKGEWTKHENWPTPEDWPKLQGWIVRRKLTLAAAIRSSFPGDVQKIFRDLYEILRFTSLPD
ncbi:MAG TPA: DUF2461 family protein [Terriglobales bacterium]|nr:DUF2461 family protein [Terriglobales bacterium]